MIVVRRRQANIYCIIRGSLSACSPQVFDAEVLVALEADEARLALERGEAERAWAARCGRDTAPPDVLAERDDWGAAAPAQRTRALTFTTVQSFPPNSSERSPLTAQMIPTEGLVLLPPNG